MPLVFKWRGRTANHSSFFFPYSGPKNVGQQGRRLGPWLGALISVLLLTATTVSLCYGSSSHEKAVGSRSSRSLGDAEFG